MSRRPKNWPAGRWGWMLLLTGLLAGGQQAMGQALPPVLRRTVTATPGNRSLGAVLVELSRQSGVPFSYSSSLVPTAARCQLPAGPPRPLGEVLREVLRAKHLSYGLLNGQLVLWPDHVAAPPNIVAVNGSATPATQPVSGSPAPTASTSAVASRVTNAPLQPAAKPRRVGVSAGAARRAGDSRYVASATKNFPAAGTLPPTSGANTSGRRASAVPTTPKSALDLPPRTTHGRPGLPPTQGGAADNEPVAAAGLAQPASPFLTVKSQKGRLSMDVSRHHTSAGTAATVNQAFSLAQLRPRPVRLAAPPLAGTPVSLPVGPAPVAASRPAVKKPPLNIGSFLRQSYLHGEVWGGESLPLNVAAKLGAQRLYLVLGASTGAFGRRGGPAGGVGLGTAGTARGRVTPSLDIIYWFLAGDRDDEVAHTTLAQLRPAVAWQLRQNGQLQLFGGPTLNLATAHHDGNRRWSLGQDQWLWIDKTDDQDVTRLWPGVQVGLHF